MGGIGTKFWFGDDEIPENVKGLKKHLKALNEKSSSRIIDVNRDLARLRDDVHYMALILKGVLNAVVPGREDLREEVGEKKFAHVAAQLGRAQGLLEAGDVFAHFEDVFCRFAQLAELLVHVLDDPCRPIQPVAHRFTRALERAGHLLLDRLKSVSQLLHLLRGLLRRCIKLVLQ